jgi:RNA polymerase sigma-70 factor, ECF subfamily
VPPGRTAAEGLEAVLASTFHEEWGRVVAGLIHMAGDWDLAEECAGEAFRVALERWKRDGVPEKPGAWVMTVARNAALDRLRRASLQARKLPEIASESRSRPRRGAEDEAIAALEGATEGEVPDERLRLMFTCCHPALAMEARVALTLRTLAGLSTAEIARAFLVPEATMAKRLTRAKEKIQRAGIPYRVPPARELPARTSGVLAVLYLLFNEGYAASAGEQLVRAGLCDEAIRLARCLTQLMPEEAEVRGLLALMLFHGSRQRSRVDGEGRLVRLEDQDRSLWDKAMAGEARALLDSLVAESRPGPYQLQAAIAACHSGAPGSAGTDWGRIERLYRQLADITGSPVVELNRAVALAMASGPAAGLEMVDNLVAGGSLSGYYLLPATRADFLRRLQRWEEAAEAYREALALVGTGPERRFLADRLAEMDG